MLATVDRMARTVQPDARREEPATALGTREGRQEEDCGHPFAGRERSGTQHLLMAALGTVQQSAHSSSIVHVPRSVKGRGVKRASRNSLRTGEILGSNDGSGNSNLLSSPRS